jgi:hypothetical protein
MEEEKELLEELLKEVSEDKYIERVPGSNIYETADALVNREKAIKNVVADIEKIEKNELVNIVKTKGFCNETIDILKQELVEEISFLKDLRDERVDVEDVDQIIRITEKRTKILKDLLDVLTKEEAIKKDRKREKIDFYGEGFQKVFSYLLRIIKETFIKVNIPVQYVDIFFSELAKSLDNFEKEAEKLYYEKSDIVD